MQMKVWTEAYRPFMMGGDVNAPICALLEVDGPFDLGGGINGYLATSPTGTIHVAEETTGAFVGMSIDQVREDIATADPAVIREQLAGAIERAKEATPFEEDEFWGMLQE